jgi:rfaE bifunctional protein kinase chain/domain
MPGIDYRDLFDRFSQLKVMVVGDVMVDAYIFGQVERISPEAPVPVVLVDRRISKLGGAANVALNVKSLGAVPMLCSVIGDDQKGLEFRELMNQEGLSSNALVTSGSRITTTKFRIIGNNTQMLRVDEEVTTGLEPEEERLLLGKISTSLDQDNISVIILQDYNKGVLTPSLIDAVIRMAGAKGIPVCVDPKKKNFLSYRGATLFKPNLKELREGLNRDVNPDNMETLASAADYFHREMQIPYFMATLSEKGAFISRQEQTGEVVRHSIPAHVRNIADVSGAGDTVISVAALCLACGLDPSGIAALANLAGGLVCEEVGVVPVNREKFLDELLALA